MADKIYVICDGPPSPVAKHFVEVEDEDGKSLTAGEWTEHPLAQGYWRLGPFYLRDYSDDLKEAEAKIERLIEAGDVLAEWVGDESVPGNVDTATWEQAKRQ